MKVVINKCFGGFGLSEAAMQRYAEIKGEQMDHYPERNDPALVQVVEELGAASYGRFAELAVVEIPDGTEYEISDYDGVEHVAETHRIWS